MKNPDLCYSFCPYPIVLLTFCDIGSTDTPLKTDILGSYDLY